MSYQGERARPTASAERRCFEVSKVRIGPDGQVVDVLWGELEPEANRPVGEPVRAPVAEVVDAIHEGARVVAVFTATKPLRPERDFLVMQTEDGRECIAFAKASSPGRNLSDVASLED
jgi:hypothetical protein